MKVNAQTPNWTKTYGTPYTDYGYSIDKTYDGGYMLAGTSKSYNNSTLNDVYCVRTNAQGDTLWTKNYAMAGNDIAYSVTVTNGNYFLIAGKTNTYNTTTTANYSAFALKINMQGNVLFFETYGTDANDVCAYTVKEMPDLSYVLAGTRADAQNNPYPHIIKIGEWGEVIDSIYSDTPAEIRSFCITDNQTIVTVGKMFNATTGWDIYFEADALCKLYYPRYIWVNNVFNKALAAQPNNIIVFDTGSNTWQVDNQKLGDLSSYLSTLKYSGIVITHLEDVFKNADSTQLKNCMAQVVASLHNMGFPTILNQFRTDEEDMTAIDSRDFMIKHLSSSILYNQTVQPLERFDGLLLDYEFWGEDYAMNTGYAEINDGYRYFDAIAHEFTAAKANPANHFKTLAMWIGNTVFACDTCDFNGDGFSGNNTIHARPDDEALMNMFDSQQFDRLVLSFFLDDEVTPANSTNPFKSPITFLQRPASGNNINQFFARLYYLGENNYPTNVIPQFHAGYGNGTASNPKLENYLNGTGPWWTLLANGNGAPRFLHEVEQIFHDQYYDPLIFASQGQNIVAPNDNWGTTAITKGFEWFRYQIGPLDYSTLGARANDKIKIYHWTCGSTLRLSQPATHVATLTNTNANAMVELSVTPQPLQSNGQLILKNFNCDDIDNIRFNFYNSNGQQLDNAIVVKQIVQSAFAIVAAIANKANYEGLVLIQATHQNQVIASAKSLIIKNQ
jgi:hypothetical protein